MKFAFFALCLTINCSLAFGSDDLKKEVIIPDGVKENETFIEQARNAMNEAVPNFNSNHVVFISSCGGGCVYGGIVNKTSGLVTIFPNAFYTVGSDDEEFDVTYKKNSNLICFYGKRISDDISGNFCYLQKEDVLEPR